MLKKRKIKIKLFVLLLFVVAACLIHLTKNVNPVITQVSETEVKALAEIAVNNACAEVMNQYFAVDMIEYVMDDCGSLQLITANTSVMNTISREATEISQENITQLGEQGVPIPLGSLSGITLLAGRGPNVYVKVFPVGAASAEFSSEFVSAGINQTRHKIILTVTADIKVVMPSMNNVVKTQTQILMCENIIVGKVPDTYFDMNNFSELLNLVP
ncbi:MAG: sporulation protein YunB [Clostridia bacterium]|nr:sporulation protein YunB [Clostridia bacterium]